MSLTIVEQPPTHSPGMMTRVHWGTLDAGSGAVYEVAAGTAPAGTAAAVGPDLTARLARGAARGEELTVRGRVAGDEVLGSPGATRSGIARFWILEIQETQEISAR